MSTPPPLKPMTAGDILDQAIRIYRENFVALVTIVAIVNVPLILIQVAASALTLPLGNDFGADAPLTSAGAATLFGLATVVSTILSTIGNIFVYGAISHFVSRRFLGQPSSVRDAYGSAFSRWLALLIGALLIGLANILLLIIFLGVIFIPTLGVGVLGSNLGDGASAVAGLLVLCLCVLFIPAIFVSLFFNTKWSFWTQAIVIEKYNSTGGLGRSWKLIKGTFWRVLGFNLILSIIVGAFSAGPIFLLSLGTTFLPSPLFRLVLQSVATSAVVMIMTPLQFATLTVLYYDLRIRKEGFDLQMQMKDE